MDKDILNLLSPKGRNFSKGKKLISEYILNNYEKAAFMTALKLGNIVGVSESTVVRFAFDLGFDGYPHLQKALQELIKNKLTSVQRIEVASQQIGTTEILDKVLNSDIEKVRKTLEQTSRDNFNGAVEALCEAKTIYIIAARSAVALAQFMAYYFNLMFGNAVLVKTSSSSEIFEQIMRVDENDVMIGISFPRYSQRTAKALNYAKSKKAKVIAITDSESSPLVPESDFFLQARSEMVSFVDSLVAPFSLVNALIVAVGSAKSEQVTESFNRLERIWDEYEVYQKSDNNK